MSIFKKKSASELLNEVDQMMKKAGSASSVKSIISTRNKLLDGLIVPKKDGAEKKDNTKPVAEEKKKDAPAAESKSEPKAENPANGPVEKKEVQTDLNKEFTRLYETNPNFKRALRTIYNLVLLLKNHSNKPKNEEIHLLKYIGFEPENLKQIVLAILTSASGNKIKEDDVNTLLSEKISINNYLIKNVFGVKEAAGLEPVLEELTETTKNFKETLAFMDESNQGKKIEELLFSIVKTNPRPSDLVQVSMAKEKGIEEHSGKEAVLLDQAAIQEAIERKKVRETRQNAPKPVDNSTPAAAPAAKVVPEAKGVSGAILYLVQLHEALKGKTPQQKAEIAIRINDVFADADQLGFGLIGKELPESKVLEMIKMQFELDNLDEAALKAVEVCKALKSLFPIAIIYP